jgi:hypothetical protein
VKAFKAFQLLYLFIDPDHYDLDDKASDLRGALLKMTHTIMLKAIAKYCYIFTEEFVEVLAQFAPIPIQVRHNRLSSLVSSSTTASRDASSTDVPSLPCARARVGRAAASPTREQHGANAADGEKQPNLKTDATPPTRTRRCSHIMDA